MVKCICMRAFDNSNVKVFVCLFLHWYYKTFVLTENFCHDNVNVKNCTKTWAEKWSYVCSYTQPDSVEMNSHRNCYLQSMQNGKLLECAYCFFFAFFFILFIWHFKVLFRYTHSVSVKKKTGKNRRWNNSHSLFYGSLVYEKLLFGFVRCGKVRRVLCVTDCCVVRMYECNSETSNRPSPCSFYHFDTQPANFQCSVIVQLESNSDSFRQMWMVWLALCFVYNFQL